MSEPPPPESPQDVVRSRGYVRLLLLAALIGVPVSLAAFAFLAVLHQLTHLVWDAAPERLGLDGPPWWWPLPWLVLGGALVGTAIRFLPGRGGHVPVDGLGTDPVPPRSAPGVLLAGLGGLPLGAVLGPEAPLIAIGSALTLALVRPLGLTSAGRAGALVAVAGSSAAISAIFGNPLIGAVFVLEAVGLAGPMLARVLLPCLLASGIGSLVFTGLGGWTGVTTVSIALPDLAGPARPDLPDLLWTVPVAVAVAFGMRQVHRIGRWTATRAARRPLLAAIGAALLIGACAATYSLITGRSPVELVLSGQETLPALATTSETWTTTALAILVVLKGLAYAVSLGALRGGLIFPAVFLGAAAGVLVSALPGYGLVPALAAGMAAATASIFPLPVASTILVVILLGPTAAAMSPIVLIAVVVAFTSEQIIERSGTGVHVK